MNLTAYLKAAALTLLAIGLLAGGRFIGWRSARLASLEPPPPGIEQAVAPTSPTATLLLFGDSRVAQWQPLPERPYRIVVAGFPGETAIQLRARLPAAIASARPAVVLLEAGVNDAVAAAVARPAHRKRALAASLAAFEQMAADARAAGASLIILRVLPPVRPEPVRRVIYGGRVNHYVAALNAALPAIAARHGARLADPQALLAGADGRIPGRYRHDTLHLTPAAYTALAPLFPPTVKAPG